MFAAGFQSFAFQTADNDNGWLGGGLKDEYSYSHPFIEYQNREVKLRQEKTELEKLESAVSEFERKAALAAKSKELAESRAKKRLERLEQEYLQEINRLEQVRAMLMLSIRQNEEALILLMMQMRRRLRA